MGDKTMVAKARQQLEDLYTEMPDASVDLTFKDFASYQHEDAGERKNTKVEPIHEQHKDSMASPKMSKSPSLDFNKAFPPEEELSQSSSKMNNSKGSSVVVDSSDLYDNNRAHCSTSPIIEKAKRKRQGIPHSNSCALCNNYIYIYIFRNRCLVCGRVYCKKCVGEGMGEMTQGRKCVEYCLGQKFSLRYIHKAGKSECCWTYPSAIKQKELKWAEKGPRRIGENQHGRNRMITRSRSPIKPGSLRGSVTPKAAARSYASNNQPSSIQSSTLSPHLYGLSV